MYMCVCIRFHREEGQGGGLWTVDGKGQFIYISI